MPRKKFGKDAGQTGCGCAGQPGLDLRLPLPRSKVRHGYGYRDAHRYDDADVREYRAVNPPPDPVVVLVAVVVVGVVEYVGELVPVKEVPLSSLGWAAAAVVASPCRLNAPSTTIKQIKSPTRTDNISPQKDKCA